MKVVKFGGSSLATGKQLEKVLQIVKADKERRIVVVSAPGKRYDSDTKVTDLLIQCAQAVVNGSDYSPYLEEVLDRYASIAKELDLSSDIITNIKNDLLDLINKYSNKDAFMEAMKASGEDNNAKLVAHFFKTRGLDAIYISPKEAGLIVSDDPGNAQVLSESYDRLYSLREEKRIIVFPGFFGYSEAGDVVTFSRSGSDITGAILANGVKAELYENFTDVDAVYSVNPSIVTQPKEIKELTYREMRELSYAGFSVFHAEALIPAYRAGIPVQVRNTNNPSASGTRIVSSRNNINGPVIGIANDKGFCSIYISKYLMNREVGFARKVLSILEDYHISYEHMPSGIDDLTIVLRQDQLTRKSEQEILTRISEELQVEEIKVEHDLALIMLVGEGMRRNIGTNARASTALAKAGVNIEMINQGSSEVSMMFGVKETVVKKAVKALYEEFFV
ncbi:aspartate kinase [Niallia circulans]|uniref:Aspartokinase n=1 Tax=Niallia circulans TaxID=1397 RepID=A0A0J1ILE8_NIACI|nr:aspartate kinase [Niallia circulans]KLV26794.1 aspartate kinase [Niallia circulans]MCM2981536.1 aspartate kinase [Niallia circulans]MDR4317150.1 aspartate kinase [Niallia circulans]MED3838131.1 aspartate kinase [Niallia circulans]MED4241539.1 aspartate kinase [Niallia circulans]